jgi:hypothetical protein
MEPLDPVADLRHTLANPLSALLSETQLALMDAETLTPEALRSFQEIERLALRMRGILRETR